MYLQQELSNGDARTNDRYTIKLIFYVIRLLKERGSQPLLWFQYLYLHERLNWLIVNYTYAANQNKKSKLASISRNVVWKHALSHHNFAAARACH